MNIYVSGKNYFRQNSQLQQAIVDAMKMLYKRISAYEKQNISFAQIFNDDHVKYDRHGEFFTYKCHKANMQLRILYTYMMIEGQPVILVADFFVKKRDSKDYIRQFDAINKTDPALLLARARLVA